AKLLLRQTHEFCLSLQLADVWSLQHHKALRFDEVIGQQIAGLLAEAIAVLVRKQPGSVTRLIGESSYGDLHPLRVGQRCRRYRWAAIDNALVDLAGRTTRRNQRHQPKSHATPQCSFHRLLCLAANTVPSAAQSESRNVAAENYWR